MKKNAPCAWVLLAAALVAAPLLGSQSGKPSRRQPTDWIEVGAALTLETASTLEGGRDEMSGFLGNFDLTFDVDPERAGAWRNGHFFVYVLGDFGDDPSTYVGDVQGTSNIEAYDTLKLYEAWYEHRFMGGAFGLLGGLHDYNSEFDVLEYAGLFLNSSFGISPDISQTNPSIFPSTAPALRGRLEGENGLYLLAAAYDGVPGDPDHPRGTQLTFGRNDGVFYGTEGGLVRGEPAGTGYYKVGAGGWYQTTGFEDFAGRERHRNGGVYAIAEASLTETLGLFLQLGTATPDRNQIGRYVGAGLNWNGLLGEDDVLGIAAAHARNSDAFMRANQPVDRAETALEMTWFLPVTRWFSLQPDLQYILHPGMDKAVDNALVFSLRAVATY